MKTVKGNLITMAENGDFDVIVHGCNCFHTMGAGIAGQLSRKYPEVLEADIEYSTYGDKNKLGTFTIALVKTKTTSFEVINGYTQFDCGSIKRYASYDAIDLVFREIANICQGSDVRIGYPMIGAGLAGGDWDIIKVIINKALDGFDHTLVEYDPNA